MFELLLLGLIYQGGVMSQVLNVTLNNGIKIPILGLGTWQSKPGEVEQAVKYAIDIGYRLIDCAHVYQNEKEVGKAISEKIAEGVVKREDLFIVGKLWVTFHNPNIVEKALKITLTDLGLEYVDSYLMHWPMGFKEGDSLYPVGPNGIEYSEFDYVDTWKKMEEAYTKGLTKSIGLSNFNKNQIERIIKHGSIVPAINQIECHPYLTQYKLAEFCASKNISLMAYSPLASPSRPWAKPNDPKLLEDPKVKEIAGRLQKSSAQIILKYLVERGFIVIPKSINKARIKENFEIFDFHLSSDDIAKINTLNVNGRVVAFADAKTHKYYPFHDEY